LRDLEFPEKVLDGVGIGECCGPFHERRRHEAPSHKNKRPRSENCLVPRSTPCGSNRVCCTGPTVSPQDIRCMIC